MIPVFQTKTVGNDGRGNCFTACVASIMKLPLRDLPVPMFDQDRDGWDAWATQREVEINWRRGEAPMGYAIASGQGGRIYPEGHEKAGEPIFHAVVVFNGDLIHDPFPGGKGIDWARYYWTIDPRPPGPIAARQEGDDDEAA